MTAETATSRSVGTALNNPNNMQVATLRENSFISADSSFPGDELVHVRDMTLRAPLAA